MLITGAFFIHQASGPTGTFPLSVRNEAAIALILPTERANPSTVYVNKSTRSDRGEIGRRHGSGIAIP